MQYIIMFLIVLGLAFADFVTGYIKARCKDEVSSKALRIGGLHKVSELTIMLSAIGLTVGLEKLGGYYSDTRLTSLAGAFTALTVFVYITAMEIISIVENFAEIYPEATWARKIISRLKKYEDDKED
ncbi:MAG: phage holin family protein [Ruminococcus sp.]|nr:phage holin family protein [Ruminococcus sp.]